MSFDARKLLDLLPPLYRIRDQAQAVFTPGMLEPAQRTRLAELLALPSPTDGEKAERDALERQATAGPLASLLAVLAEQIAVLEEDLDQLYDDQFIETCAPWVAPYIGDLIGYRMLHGVAPAVSSPRAEVAHTIAFRRRKGTLAVLEDLARDVTGWDARAVELFTLLVTTQHTNHRRLGNFAAPDLRRWEPLERVGTAFDSIARTVDVRRIGSGRGRYNIPNVAIFLYRIGAQPLRRSPAVALDDRRRRFHPLGLDLPLYTSPATLDRIGQLATPLNVPAPISRRVLDDRLTDYYSDDGVACSLSLYVGADPAAAPVPADQICVCNLADDGGGWAHMPADKFAVDPALGRFTVPVAMPPGTEVRADFHFGFGGELGGGEYDRVFDKLGRTFTLIKVPTDVPTIQAALDALHGDGVVEIEDSGRYAETLSIAAAANGRVELRAANGRRPTLVLGGELALTGGAGSEIVLDGLLVSGQPLRAPAAGGNALARLTIRHTTLVPGLTLAPDATPASPGQPSLFVETPELAVAIARSILGPVRADPTATVRLDDSILDATAKTAVAYASTHSTPAAAAGGALTLNAVTVVGKVSAVELPLVSNSVVVAELASGDGWTAPVVAVRRQVGCVRYSFVPAAARVPRRYRCLPESASDPTAATPAFASLRYGRPTYGQLGPGSGAELATAADDEGQPGAFHFLFQPHRETNLWVRLAEYLRTSMEAGVVHQS